MIINGTRIASSGDHGDVGHVEHERDHERHDEHRAREPDVDRERAGPVALLALEVQPAARAVVDDVK